MNHQSSNISFPKGLFLLLISCGGIPAAMAAETQKLSLAPCFSSHMVLQQWDEKTSPNAVILYGKSKTEYVAVQVDGLHEIEIKPSGGEWRLRKQDLAEKGNPFTTDRSHTISISAYEKGFFGSKSALEKLIPLTDVQVGEVWIVGKNPETTGSARPPGIPNRTRFLFGESGPWIQPGPALQSDPNCTASVAYFAKKLSEITTPIAVGIIVLDLGGAKLEMPLPRNEADWVFVRPRLAAEEAFKKAEADWITNCTDWAAAARESKNNGLVHIQRGPIRPQELTNIFKGDLPRFGFRVRGVIR